MNYPRQHFSLNSNGTKLDLNYGSGVNGDDFSHIFIINTDGSGMTQVTGKPDYDGAPSWVYN
jgi:hypothetical protein